MFFLVFLITGPLMFSATFQEKAEKTINEYCPVLPDEKIDLNVFTVYQGQTIYFCCKKCKKKFLENPLSYAADAAGQETHPEEHQQEHTHDHAMDHGEPQGILRAIRFLGKFHPIAVHFPIALLLFAAFVEFMSLFSTFTLWRELSRITIIFAAIAAVLAGGLGWAAWSFANYPGELADVLEWHRWLGTSTAALAILCVIFSESSRRSHKPGMRKLFLLSLFLAAGLVGVTGYYGGALIYGLEHFMW